MLVSWLNRFRSRLLSTPFCRRHDRRNSKRFIARQHDASRAQIETLEERTLLAAAYVSSFGGSAGEIHITEGGSASFDVSSWDFVMPGESGTVNYLIENTGGGLNETTFSSGGSGSLDLSFDFPSVFLDVSTFDNTVDELPREFRVTFAPGTGIDWVDEMSWTVTVHDNDFDTSIAYQPVDITVNEGVDEFSVDPSGGGGGFTAYYTQDGTASFNDYSGGSTEAKISIYQDLIDEYDETFSVFASSYVSDPTINGYYYNEYAPWTAEYRVTIADDDAEPIAYFNPDAGTLGGLDVTEGDTWFGEIYFEGQSEKDISLIFSTLDGGADSGATPPDYQAENFDLALTGGLFGYDEYTPYSVFVATLTDMLAESPEEFQVSLSNPVNVQLAVNDPLKPVTQTVWIVDPQGMNPPDFIGDPYTFYFVAVHRGRTDRALN